MPHRNKIIGLFFAAVLGAAAQQQEPPTFTSDTRLVVLHASVMDKNGKLLTGLPREAFKVYENGAEQQIRGFKREDVPVSMGLIIDNSGSMRDKRQKVEAAALALVKRPIAMTKCSSSTSTTTRFSMFRSRTTSRKWKKA